jgi:Tfp pilus assembly protein PilO
MNSRMRIILTSVGMVVVAALVALLVIRPMMERTKADRAAIQECRGQLVKLERVNRRISDLQEEVRRLEGALEFFENRLPAEREVDVILREVWLIAESKSLTPRSIRTTPPQAMPRYNSQPITMALEGRFESFYEFLLGLECLPRITKVRQMQLAKSPLTEGVVQVDLLMDIFFEKDR